jgi:hypothetical protein
MGNRFGRLTLRDLFWLILLAAIAVGWYLERTRSAKQIAEYRVRWPFGQTPTTQPSATALKRQQLLSGYKSLSNEQLNKTFVSLAPATAFHASDEYQCALMEMARRKMDAELQVHYDNFMQVGDKQYGGPANALLLTALRRAQGKTDPVEVQVKVDVPTTIVNDLPEASPGILVNLKNGDTEEICLERGGDYRSGRQTRWRVQLTNEKGVRLADSNFPPNMIGGGISSHMALKPTESLYEENRLDARSYVKSPPSGRYQLQAIYAGQEIADEPDLTGLIVWQSQPIDVLVENQTAAVEQRFSAVPLLGVLICGVVVFVAAAVVRRRNRPIAAEQRKWWRHGRDYVAMTLLVAATLGWLVDAHLLSREIERLRPDQQAQWSLLAADSQQ